MTRRLLLDGAREAFAPGRYTDVTIDEIASVAGTSRATFYLYFTKAEVLMELLREGFHDEDSSLGHRSLGRGGEALGYPELRRYLGHHVNAWRRYRSLAAAWMEGDGSDPEVRRMTDRRIAQSVHDLAEVVTTQRGRRGLPVSERDARARAAVMDIQLQYVSYYLTVRDLELDVESVVDLLAQQWYCALYSSVADAGTVVVDGPA
jgi:AcrR family transcriptional regulator